MSVTDPIADMLTRIRNANSARKDEVEIPYSKIKWEIAKILKEEGFIKACFWNSKGKKKMPIKVYLKYGPRPPVHSAKCRTACPPSHWLS